MKQSENIGNIVKALAAAQGKFSVIAKTSDNPFFKSKYADLAEVVRPTAPILAEHGLSVIQGIGYDEGCQDTLTTTLAHISGEYFSTTMRLYVPKSDPQGQGSAVTYARRYSYMAILGLVADEDDDGNAASRPRSVDQAQQSRPTRNAEAPKREFAPMQLTDQIQAILDAAKKDPSDTFLTSLSEQWDARASLSPKQVEKGYAQAMKVLHSVTPATSSSNFDLREGEEPF